jgi:hypothetical protein
MSQAIRLWSIWQDLLGGFAAGFTRKGFLRFREWATAMVLNVEEHTITQSVTALDRLADWKAMESFAEYGSWDPQWVARCLTRLTVQAKGALWHGYRIVALDDTKVHRGSDHVWGTCTFHEYTARCPNRATTVRAHNWVALGALIRVPNKPAWYLPISGALYFRRQQLPPRQGMAGPRVEFRTKCQLAVGLIRDQVRLAQVAGKPGKPRPRPIPTLAVFDGGYALKSVVVPLVRPEDGSPRVDFLTRLRHDARLFDLPPKELPAGRRGRKPVWGRRLPPPRQGGRWKVPWKKGVAFIYGRLRRVRWKEVICLWHVLGHETVVKVVVAEVEGYKKRFTLVTSALSLTGLQMVELFAARFRQEDAFRDLKQRLGWEECRAWTRNPIERTTQVQWVALSLMRLAQFRLDAEDGKPWWSPPPWNRRKDRPSVLDVERLFRRHAGGFRQFLSNPEGVARKSASSSV